MRIKQIRIILVWLLLACCIPVLRSQTSRQELSATPEKAGGVLYAYPYCAAEYTPAPEGYYPFYISHFGRHGSRYLTEDSQYKWSLEVFEAAHKDKTLTPVGTEVYRRLQAVWLEAEDCGGDLSPLGVSQQREIAGRMYRSFPEVFAKGSALSARSTIVVRCVLSMDAFCERLKELNPQLEISRQASRKYMRYLDHQTPKALAFRAQKEGWRQDHHRFTEAHTNPERLMKTLFNDTLQATFRVEPTALMRSLFQIAVNMQNMQSDITLFDIFENGELFDLWQCGNYHHYLNSGPSATSGGIMMYNAAPLLENIIESANRVIAGGGCGADLRFGHDGNIMPLAALLHLKGCYNSKSDPEDFYSVWNDFKVAPMAANIQIVFFRKEGTEDVLVKFLHNENEIFIPPVTSDVLPYYHWKDIKAFYRKVLDKGKEMNLYE